MKSPWLTSPLNSSNSSSYAERGSSCNWRKVALLVTTAAFAAVSTLGFVAVLNGYNITSLAGLSHISLGMAYSFTVLGCGGTAACIWMAHRDNIKQKEVTFIKKFKENVINNAVNQLKQEHDCKELTKSQIQDTTLQQAVVYERPGSFGLLQSQKDLTKAYLEVYGTDLKLWGSLLPMQTAEGIRRLLEKTADEPSALKDSGAYKLIPT